MNPRYNPLQTRECALLHAYLVSQGTEPEMAQDQLQAGRDSLPTSTISARTLVHHNLPPNMLSHAWLPLSRLISNLRGQHLLQTPHRPSHPEMTIICAGGSLESRLFTLFAE